MAGDASLPSASSSGSGTGESSRPPELNVLGAAKPPATLLSVKGASSITTAATAGPTAAPLPSAAASSSATSAPTATLDHSNTKRQKISIGLVKPVGGAGTVKGTAGARAGMPKPKPSPPKGPSLPLFEQAAGKVSETTVTTAKEDGQAPMDVDPPAPSSSHLAPPPPSLGLRRPSIPASFPPSARRLSVTAAVPSAPSEEDSRAVKELLSTSSSLSASPSLSSHPLPAPPPPPPPNPAPTSFPPLSRPSPRTSTASLPGLAGLPPRPSSSIRREGAELAAAAMQRRVSGGSASGVSAAASDVGRERERERERKSSGSGSDRRVKPENWEEMGYEDQKEWQRKEGERREREREREREEKVREEKEARRRSREFESSGSRRDCESGSRDGDYGRSGGGGGYNPHSPRRGYDDERGRNGGYGGSQPSYGGRPSHGGFRDGGGAPQYRRDDYHSFHKNNRSPSPRYGSHYDDRSRQRPRPSQGYDPRDSSIHPRARSRSRDRYNNDDQHRDKRHRSRSPSSRRRQPSTDASSGLDHSSPPPHRRAPSRSPSRTPPSRSPSNSPSGSSPRRTSVLDSRDQRRLEQSVKNGTYGAAKEERSSSSGAGRVAPPPPPPASAPQKRTSFPPPPPPAPAPAPVAPTAAVTAEEPPKADAEMSLYERISMRSRLQPGQQLNPLDLARAVPSCGAAAPAGAPPTFPPPPPSLPPRPQPFSRQPPPPPPPPAPYHPANPASLPSDQLVPTSGGGGATGASTGLSTHPAVLRTQRADASAMPISAASSPSSTAFSPADSPVTNGDASDPLASSSFLVRIPSSSAENVPPPIVGTDQAGLELFVSAPSPSHLPPALSAAEEASTDALLDGRKYIGSSHISEYTLKEVLGEGTFGRVFKGIRGVEQGRGARAGEAPGMAGIREERERKEEEELVRRGLRVRKGDVVALKQITLHAPGDGMPITSVREIRILKMLNHPNIVPVVDIAVEPADPASFSLGSTYMVFPYMDHDLAGLLENPRVKLEMGHIKQYGKQLLEGTAYLHRNLILHRDMKAANLLISNKGQLMIADFGLARSVEKASANAAYTSTVVTRWYRPPEVLLNNKHYHAAIDMWGVGCVLAEMFHRGPIFPGASDFDQLARIFALCGAPTEENFPGWNKLPGIEVQEGKKQQFEWPDAGRSVKVEWERRSGDALFGDLMDKILVLDPKKRLTADQALDHEWFWTAPYPTDPSCMPTYDASHEMDRKQNDGQQRAVVGQALPEGLHPTNLPPKHAQVPYGAPPPVSAFNGPPPPPPPMLGQHPMNGGGGGGYGAPPGIGGGGGYGPPGGGGGGGGGMGGPRYGPGPPGLPGPPPGQFQSYAGQGMGASLNRPQQQYGVQGPSWGRPGPGGMQPNMSGGTGKKVNLKDRMKRGK